MTLTDSLRAAQRKARVTTIRRLSDSVAESLERGDFAQAAGNISVLQQVLITALIDSREQVQKEHEA